MVCAVLGVGGTARYDLVVGSGLKDSWVLKNVAHNISKYHFCRKIAVVFEKVILWACFDPLTSCNKPEDILSRA